MKKKALYYEIPDHEILCGLVDKYCLHCGIAQIVIRKVRFTNKLIHYEMLCYACLRHNFYAPTEMFYWSKQFPTYQPIAKSNYKTWKTNPLEALKEMDL